MLLQAPRSAAGKRVRWSLPPSVTAALALGIFVVDVVLPGLLHAVIVTSVLYVVVVLLSMRFLQPRGVVLVAVGCVLLTWWANVLSPPSEGFFFTMAVNRLLSSLAIALTAFLVVRNQVAEEAKREEANLLAQTEAKLARAALEERQRLARELHDSVSQSVYGIALNTSTARDVFDSSPEDARELVGDALHLAEACLTELRALIFELRPESLEQEGLGGALERQAAAVAARHGLQVRLSVGDEPELPVRTKEALYRIAQEALHNAAKHARAHSLDVALDVAGSEVRLVVTDDGDGFDPKQEFPGHLGLTSMRERVTTVGGTLEINSAPGAGTRLTARVPLAPDVVLRVPSGFH